MGRTRGAHTGNPWVPRMTRGTRCHSTQCEHRKAITEPPKDLKSGAMRVFGACPDLSPVGWHGALHAVRALGSDPTEDRALSWGRPGRTPVHTGAWSPKDGRVNPSVKTLHPEVKDVHCTGLRDTRQPLPLPDAPQARTSRRCGQPDGGRACSSSRHSRLPHS